MSQSQASPVLHVLSSHEDRTQKSCSSRKALWSQDDIATLYHRHSFAVYRRCMQLLRNETEAKDMVQTVFVRALENRESFRGHASPSTYLYSIATNFCLNRLRDHKARSNQWQEHVAGYLEQVMTPSTPESHLETRRIVESILEDADETTRLIALYAYVDGLSQGEIAKLVGLSRVTVNHRLKHFRENALRVEKDRDEAE